MVLVVVVVEVVIEAVMVDENKHFDKQNTRKEITFVLQSFCSIKLVWLNSLLANISDETLILARDINFVYAWAIITFFAKIMGGYTLGKFAEAHAFLTTQKSLSQGIFLQHFCSFFVVYMQRIFIR